MLIFHEPNNRNGKTETLRVAITNKLTQCESTDEQRVKEREREEKREKINTPKIYLYINHFINDFRLFLRGFEVKQK